MTEIKYKDKSIQVPESYIENGIVRRPVHIKHLEAEIKITDILDLALDRANPTIEEWVRRSENRERPIQIIFDGVWVTGVSQDSVNEPGVRKYVTNIRLMMKSMEVRNG
ncbi:hypothetical protein KAR91_22990 [Candidatus Pacearchaeota archaeon]|nr:hypothetical protein [Candidatus Pacearchaeota archaeon]